LPLPKAKMFRLFLGRADIFDRFKVCYDSKRLETEFTSKSQKAEELAKRIDEIKQGTQEAPSVTEAVVKSHEEDEF